MAERRNIGEILMGFGRISRDDLTRAVEYQRVNGGFLGEALVALGSLTREELEWSLASQFDIPYVFPDAGSVDPEAVALVTPEWALTHLALPITKTDRTLTVIVDSPLKSRAVEELQARTDLDIELALASTWKIRELVRQLFARQPVRDISERAAVLRVDVALGSAIEAASRRFGISTRGNRVWFWYDDDGSIRRRPLDAAWREGLDRLASPRPSDLLGPKRDATVETELIWQGFQHPVELRYLSTGVGEEYVFRPVREQSRVEERFPSPPGSVLSEVRLLARSSTARFLVYGEPADLGRELVPHLPRLLLDPSWRSVHVVARPHVATEEVFSVIAPLDAADWEKQAEGLRTFHFDAVSVDPSGADTAWALGALEVASVAFVLWNEGIDKRSAHDAGIRWELHVARALGHTLSWRLDPLQV
jgi:hypothetical protein